MLRIGGMMQNSFTINCRITDDGIDDLITRQLSEYCAKYGIMNVVIRMPDNRAKITFFDSGSRLSYARLRSYIEKRYDEVRA